LTDEEKRDRMDLKETERDILLEKESYRIKGKID
jgi:hypothetical protein